MVRPAEALVARLVARDEQIGVDHRGEPVHCLGGRVASPGQGVDGAPPLHGLVGPARGLEEAEVERVEIDAVGNRVANEHSVGRAYRKGKRGEEFEVDLETLARAGTVGQLDPLPESYIERSEERRV